MHRWIRSKTIAGLLALGWPMVGQAQPADNAALAESLFRTAKKLMQEGAVAEACPKFAESYRLDPTLGTLLNLAVCHEQQGRTATAWAELHDAAARAARTGEKERATFARQRADALEGRLSRLTIRVSDGVPGLEIRLDDGALGQAAWSTAMPVDPGAHKIEARAPGRQSWSRTVSVGAGPSAEEVQVPPLAPVVEAAPPMPVIVAPTSPAEAPPAGSSGRSSARLAAGWTAAAVGVAGLGVGSYFGLRTFSQQKIVKRECMGSVCSAEGQAADHEAHLASRWSNVGFGVGLVGLATATYFFLSGPSSSSPRATAWQIVPVAFDGPGLTAGRRW